MRWGRPFLVSGHVSSTCIKLSQRYYHSMCHPCHLIAASIAIAITNHSPLDYCHNLIPLAYYALLVQLRLILRLAVPRILIGAFDGAYTSLSPMPVMTTMTGTITPHPHNLGVLFLLHQ